MLLVWQACGSDTLGVLSVWQVCGSDTLGVLSVWQACGNDRLGVLSVWQACGNDTLGVLSVWQACVLCFVKVGLLVGCLTPQQRICTGNFACCYTEIGVADQTFYLTQSQYTDTGPTSPSADPIMPGVWQGSHWSANF